MESGSDALGLQRRGRARLNLGAAHIAELVAEIAPLVRGAQLSEIVALPPRDLVLYFRRDAPEPGRALVRRVHVSADGDAPRLYLQTARQAHPSGPLGPFFRRLVEELANARAKRVETVAGDRIALLEFDETPRGEKRTLVAELVGRHANLVLLGGSDRVLDVLVPPPAESKNSARLKLGATWQPPGGTPKAASGAPSLAELLSGPEIDPDAKPDPLAPLSFLVQERLGREVAEIVLARARKTLVERVQRKLERARSLSKGLEQRLAAASEAESVRLDGETLKVHLHAIPRGAKEVELPDPFDESGATRRIALDPRRGPRENVEAVFERYRKLLRAQQSVADELATCRAKVAALEQLLAEADGPDPAAVDARAVEAGLLDPPQEPDERKRAAPEPRKPYRVFQGLKGSEIRVGRNAKDNDELSLHHCRGNDVWLHTADAPGSHVVLRVEKGAEPDPEELLDAAHLAAHFSPMREARRVNVHVARGKDVHKPRGAKPGLVSLSGGKTLAVRVQPERLARLLDRPESRGPSN